MGTSRTEGHANHRSRLAMNINQDGINIMAHFVVRQDVVNATKRIIYYLFKKRLAVTALLPPFKEAEFSRCSRLQAAERLSYLV